MGLKVSSGVGSRPDDADASNPAMAGNEKALLLNSTDQSYVSVADIAALRPGNGNWSVALWAKPPNTNQLTALVSKRRDVSPNYDQYSLYITGDLNAQTTGKKLCALFIEHSTISKRASLSTVDVADGNWHHFVMVADKTAGPDHVQLYADGIQLASTTSDIGVWPTISNTDALLLGASNQPFYFDGKTADVRVYSTALSAAQISALYHGATGSCVNSLGANLVGWWKLNEGASTTAYDSSGNGNHGTLINAPTWVTGPVDCNR